MSNLSSGWGKKEISAPLISMPCSYFDTSTKIMVLIYIRLEKITNQKKKAQREKRFLQPTRSECISEEHTLARRRRRPRRRRRRVHVRRRQREPPRLPQMVYFPQSPPTTTGGTTPSSSQHAHVDRRRPPPRERERQVPDMLHLQAGGQGRIVGRERRGREQLDGRVEPALVGGGAIG